MGPFTLNVQVTGANVCQFFLWLCGSGLLRVMIHLSDVGLLLLTGVLSTSHDARLKLQVVLLCGPLVCAANTLKGDGSMSIIEIVNNPIA